MGCPDLMGLWATTVTPYEPNGSFDDYAVRRHLSILVANGVSGPSPPETPGSSGRGRPTKSYYDRIVGTPDGRVMLYKRSHRVSEQLVIALGRDGSILGVKYAATRP